MEERIIKLSLDKAKEWYKKGGELKEIALQAYKEMELIPIPTYDQLVLKHPDLTNYSMMIPSSAAVEVITSVRLLTLAAILNEGWKPKMDGTKFFVKPFYLNNTIKWNVYIHNTVIYPGVAYFKTNTLALKALEILRKELEALDIK